LLNLGYNNNNNNPEKKNKQKENKRKKENKDKRTKRETPPGGLFCKTKNAFVSTFLLVSCTLFFSPWGLQFVIITIVVVGWVLLFGCFCFLSFSK